MYIIAWPIPYRSWYHPETPISAQGKTYMEKAMLQSVYHLFNHD